MTEVWVVDAGPLIFLAKLGHLRLLERAGTIIVPETVWRETQQHDDQASAMIADASRSWLKVRQVSNTAILSPLLNDMDSGEAEVIALAQEMRANRVVLDDMDARRVAQRHELPVVGTVGLLLAARLRDEIPSLRNELESLQRVGFWINPTLVEKALEQAGEGDP